MACLAIFSIHQRPQCTAAAASTRMRLSLPPLMLCTVTTDLKFPAAYAASSSKRYQHAGHIHEESLDSVEPSKLLSTTTLHSEPGDYADMLNTATNSGARSRRNPMARIRQTAIWKRVSRQRSKIIVQETFDSVISANGEHSECDSFDNLRSSKVTSTPTILSNDPFQRAYFPDIVAGEAGHVSVGAEYNVLGDMATRDSVVLRHVVAIHAGGGQTDQTTGMEQPVQYAMATTPLPPTQAIPTPSWVDPPAPPRPPSQLPLRFLRAGKGNVVEGIRRYKATLAWRRENKIDGILREPNPHFALIKRNYPHFFHGRGYHGEPCFYEQPPKTNLKAIREGGVSLSQLLRHYTMVTEFQWQYLVRDDLKRSIYVIDLAGMRFKDFVGEVVDYVKKASALSGQHYPERAGVGRCPNHQPWTEKAVDLHWLISPILSFSKSCSDRFLPLSLCDQCSSMVPNDLAGRQTLD